MGRVITRFAPSPTGHLHIGGARTALFSWLLARHFDGVFHLRIEDTDVERSKQEYTDTILASMHWLGLNWDGEILYQSQRTERYNKIIHRLVETQHAYWCYCSHEELEHMREEARQKGKKPRYNGCCREKILGPSDHGVIRLKVPLEGEIIFEDLVKGKIVIQASELDDMVLRRSDGTCTYQMAVVVDDHDMEVTHVIRGDDHVSNTPKQILLYKALGWHIPLFGHIPMILGSDRQKLSKRHGARSVIEYQKDGFLPQALCNYLVRLGWSHGDRELFSMKELINLFDGTSLQSSPSAFDPEKLQWLNGHYLRELPLHELAEFALPFVIKEGFIKITKEELEKILPLYRERVSTLVELAQAIKIVLLTSEELIYDESAVKKVLTHEGKEHIYILRQLLANEISFDQEHVEKVIHTYVEDNGLKFKQVGPVLRVAVSGSLGGPNLPELIAILGKAETLSRIDRMLSLDLSL